MTSSPSTPHTPNFRELLSSSARFWEPRRILYNLILLAVCLVWLVASWPHFRPALHLDTLVPMTVLALFANLCYSAAYLVDVPLLTSAARATWLSRRWILWLVGTLFAILLANYWIADEIYPDVH
ncbi:MAG TPA: hypothetical protein VKT53_09035 [Candidatus Acidoferrum sp.]|nr:hypothetical protein [Candidatus Acidoferrum sp.]